MDRSPTASPTVRVEYEQTTADLVAFQELVTARSAAYRQQVWTGAIAFALVIPYVVLLLTILTGWPFWPLPALVCGTWMVTALLVYPWAVRIQQRRLVASMLATGRNRGLLGLVAIELHPDSLFVTGEVSQTQMRWAGVERVEDTPAYLLLYISAVSAYLIPKRAFPTEREANEFLVLARQFASQAESSAAGPYGLG